MTANVRQNRAFQIFVLEEDRAPCVVCLHSGQVRSQRVGIVEACFRVDIERRVRIRLAFFIRGQRKRPLPDLYLRGSRLAKCRERSQQKQRT